MIGGEPLEPEELWAESNETLMPQEPQDPDWYPYEVVR